MEADKKQESPEVTQVNIGELLVEARENQNLSATDIASQLNLTVGIINKIEENQFEQDIPLAFIRGYVRAYAQKVGLDVNTICAEFDRQSQNEEEPVQNIQRISNFSQKRKEINTNNTLFKVISYLIVISLLSFGGWELWKRFGPKDNESEAELNTIPLNTGSDSNEENGISLDLSSAQSNAVPQTNEVPLETRSTGSNSIDTQSAERSTNELTAAASQDDLTAEANKAEDIDSGVADNNESRSEPQTQTETPAPAAQSNAEPSVVSEEPKVELKTEPVIDTEFVFTGDCWVQVKDANGEVIALGVKKSGKIMPLSGVAPFNVILGEPSVVKITLNGEAFDLSAFSPGKTARLVLQ